jgi:hypothetical protein
VKRQTTYNERSEAEATPDPPATADAILREAHELADQIIREAELRASAINNPPTGRLPISIFRERRELEVNTKKWKSQG